MTLSHITWGGTDPGVDPQALPRTITVPDGLDTLDKIAGYVHGLTGAWPKGYSVDRMGTLNL